MSIDIKYSNEHKNSLGNCHRVYLGKAGLMGVFKTEVAAYNFIIMMDKGYDPNHPSEWTIEKAFIEGIGF